MRLPVLAITSFRCDTAIRSLGLKGHQAGLYEYAAECDGFEVRYTACSESVTELQIQNRAGVMVLSVAAMALLYWLIRRSAATSFASLFCLVSAITALLGYILSGERLNRLSIVGMIVCAVGAVLANRTARAKVVAAVTAEG